MGSETTDATAEKPEVASIFEPTFIDAFIRNHEQLLIDLLVDRTTMHNIIWADNEYESYGPEYAGDQEITIEKITGKNSGLIKPRVLKRFEQQSRRTRDRAEVFTPSWLCNRMNNDLDEQWFGRRDMFNTESGEHWQLNANTIEFRSSINRNRYIKSRRLELTCGEAPFVCSRYDTVTGKMIPVSKRIGFLDRKLRVVTEQTKTPEEWLKLAIDALKATYGFEYQGDNLLVARINVLETMCEHYEYAWKKKLSGEPLLGMTDIITWNFWQMNGLNDAVPTDKIEAEFKSVCAFNGYKEVSAQPPLFDAEDPDSTTVEFANQFEEKGDKVPLCIIYNWQNNNPFEFAYLKKWGCPMDKKFYAVIGNPPYQTTSTGNRNYAPPIYHEFMDAAYQVAEKVELITPARFLFNAGSTPRDWNEKMLRDPHLQVLEYVPDASSVFSGTDIKGGVSVTYRDGAKTKSPIGVFTAYPELNAILKKVCPLLEKTLDLVISGRGVYKLSDKALSDHPEIEGKQSKGHKRDVGTSTFKILGNLIFFAEKPSDGKDYVRILGLNRGRRDYYWVRKDYLIYPDSFNSYKVFIPKANGSGALGEELSTPLVGSPLIGASETFLSIGTFKTEAEAGAALKYVKSKFARVMLGVLKITQDNTREKWKYVPLQDFTEQSDIDWSKSVAEIDQQLYKKYGLSEEEISFIETHVKEMD